MRIKRMDRHFRRPSSFSSARADQNQMRALLQRSSIELSPEQLGHLWRYHNLLRARNQERELTRIVSFEGMVIKHYVDCMIVGKFLTLPSPLLDLGSGAGFPGIPLKIRYPHLKITLAEPRPKRIRFLEEVIQTLELKNIDIFEHKVVSKSFQKRVAAVITRAVEEISATLLRTSACLGPGGKLIFMKGPNVDPELQSAFDRFQSEYRLILDKHYTLPHTKHERRLVVFEKVSLRAGGEQGHF